MDCRTLYHKLITDEVTACTGGIFHFAHVDVGEFNENRALAAESASTGNTIGTSNDGQLAPARFYASKQILRFVRNIAENSLIAAPDSVR